MKLLTDNDILNTKDSIRNGRVFFYAKEIIVGRTKEDILKDLESKYRFVEVDVNDTLRYHEFSREAEGETHKVILEDHRDDEMKDWMIFSYVECSRLDYYGDKIDEQYPLELGEVKLFLEYIECCK